MYSPVFIQFAAQAIIFNCVDNNASCGMHCKIVVCKCNQMEFGVKLTLRTLPVNPH